MGVCCLGAWCPCVVWGQTNERAGLGSFAAYCFMYVGVMIIGAWILDYIMVLALGRDLGIFGETVAGIVMGFLGMQQRKKMATRFGLDYEGDGHEFVCWWCCSSCSICQEHRTIMSYVN